MEGGSGSINMDVRMVTLPTFKDFRGELSVVELFGGKFPELDFPVKRIYYLHDLNEEATRGGHAHKWVHQVFFCISGLASCSLEDRSGDTVAVVLSKHHEGLYVPPMVWHTLGGFEPGTTILVFASDHHDEEEYIRNLEEFHYECSFSGPKVTVPIH